MTTTWTDLLGTSVKYDGNKYKGRYVEAGEGEPLILLHGQGGHVENFARNIAVYGKYFHVFALDCVWHAYGPQPPFNPELVPTYIDQVIDFMEFKGYSSAHIEGQSMGGWTAMALASKHPERVRKLVLTTVQGYVVEVPGQPEMEPTPNPAARDRQVSFLKDPSFENIRSRMTGLFANPERLPDEAIATRQKIYNRAATQKSLIDVVTAYMSGPEGACRKHVLFEKDLKQIKADTLVYWGSHNPVPPVYAEKLASTIGAKYYCAEDTGHWAQFETADEHNREVLRHLTGDKNLNPPAYDSPTL